MRQFTHFIHDLRKILLRAFLLVARILTEVTEREQTTNIYTIWFYNYIYVESAACTTSIRRQQITQAAPGTCSDLFRRDEIRIGSLGYDEKKTARSSLLKNELNLYYSPARDG